MAARDSAVLLAEDNMTDISRYGMVHLETLTCTGGTTQTITVQQPADRGKGLICLLIEVSDKLLAPSMTGTYAPRIYVGGTYITPTGTVAKAMDVYLAGAASVAFTAYAVSDGWYMLELDLDALPWDSIYLSFQNAAAGGNNCTIDVYMAND
jgi:hypothetical protein